MLQTTLHELLAQFSSLQQLHVTVGDENPFNQAPPLSYLTPPAVVRRELIVYDRQQHLMPLLRAFSGQSLSYGDGTSLSFDFKRIEESIAQGILAGKRAAIISVRHYQYAGELQSTGHLQLLQKRVPQSSLTSSVLDVIWQEIDTQERLTLLVTQLEECIRFICAIGGSAVQQIDGHVKLDQFVTGTLLIDVAQWSKISTPTLSQYTELKHLVCIMQFLDNKFVVLYVFFFVFFF